MFWYIVGGDDAVRSCIHRLLRRLTVPAPPYVLTGTNKHCRHSTVQATCTINAGGDAEPSIAGAQRQSQFWAVQYHGEYDVKEMAMLTKCRIAKLVKRGFYPDPSQAGRFRGSVMCLLSNGNVLRQRRCRPSPCCR